MGREFLDEAVYDGSLPNLLKEFFDLWEELAMEDVQEKRAGIKTRPCMFPLFHRLNAYCRALLTGAASRRYRYFEREFCVRH